jgi:predicted hydrocarbon binding protein
MTVVEPMGRKEVHLMHDFAGFATRTHCLASMGFFRGAGISVAIPSIAVEEVSCQARGNANCLIVVRWGGAAAPRRR